jgi:hypothetical protein
VEKAQFPDAGRVGHRVASASASAHASVRAELEAYRTEDAVMATVLEESWSAIIATEAVGALNELHLLVLNPAVASPEVLASPYFTDNCLALRAEMTIVVNERFLLELEGAVRAFAQADSLVGSPYLKSDAKMFGLVRSIRSDSRRFTDRLRRLTARLGDVPDGEADIRRELVMVALFFLGHEVGHLLAGHDVGEFGAFIDPNAPLDDRVDDAVVKLCRHVDEFNQAHFGLGGFERVGNPRSSIRRVAKKFRADNERRHERAESFFANEASADEWANRIVIEHFEAIPASDHLERGRTLYLLSCGLFVAALYSWYRDLDAFVAKLEPGAMSDAQSLSLTMVKDRLQYVYAASLFGEYHRFTLLRAALALEVILRAATTWFQQPVGERSVHSAHGERPSLTEQRARLAWWTSESLQRYFLLCISMDTAVKIANVGCATGWIRGMDTKRGTPQLFMMTFEPIDAAVRRLSQLR